ncbi:MAG: phosphatase PAP2 family protein [Planctomycetes bacterium]|nr:phosphatase PAP2 family protein [Planctomycetota bacterium]
MNQLDRTLSARIHGWRLGPLDYLLVVPGMLFGSYVMPLTVLALGFWLGWRFGLVCVMAALTTLAITSPMKHWIGRPRPEPLEAPRAFKIRGLVNNPSFPSGDSAQAGAITTLLILLGPLAWPVSLSFLPLIPLCMFARVYYGAHWIGDTIVGVAIGAGVAFAYAFWFAQFAGHGLSAA